MQLDTSKVAVVLPTYNNALTIRQVIEGVLSVHPHVIVVNDGCSDETEHIVKSFTGIHYLKHVKNAGKGAALKTGFQYAHSLGFTGVIVCDTDGQHQTESLHDFLREIYLTPEAVIIGAREFKEHVPFSSKFGRQFSNFWVWVETGHWLQDTQSGFRYYPLPAAIQVDTKKVRYDFEIEILVKLSWLNIVVREFKIPVYYPPKEQRISHFHVWHDNKRLSLLHSWLVTLHILKILRLYSPKRSLHTKERGGAGVMPLFLRSVGRLGCLMIMPFPLIYFFLTDFQGRAGISQLYQKLNVGVFASYFFAFKNYWYFAWSLLDRIDFDRVTIEKTKEMNELVATTFKPGSINVGAHFGDWLIAARHFQTSQNCKIAVVMEKQLSPKFLKIIEQNQLNIELFDVESDKISLMLKLKQVIDAGGCLCFLADRVSHEGPILQGQLCRTPVAIPAGPFEISRILKVPLYFFTSIRANAGSHGHYIVHLIELWNGQGKVASEHLALLYLQELEKFVYKYPAQWFNFFNYWAPHARGTKHHDQ